MGETLKINQGRGGGKAMSKIAAVLGAAVLMLACGDKNGDAPAADTTAAAAPAPAPAAAGATHDVNMVMEGTAYKFVPAELSIRSGDQVVWHNVSGGPHNVAFWPDSIPAGGKEVIDPQLKDQIAPLSSMLVVDPNATITISFANAPAGEYRYTCTPHMAMGMNGKITVTQ
jgi:plastocyanin